MVKRLTLGIDAIPYQMMKELQKEGYFSRFAPARRVISTFPSLTIPSLGRMFPNEETKESKVEGFEPGYFNREKNELFNVDTIWGSIALGSIGAYLGGRLKVVMEGSKVLQNNFDYFITDIKFGRRRSKIKNTKINEKNIHNEENKTLEEIMYEFDKSEKKDHIRVWVGTHDERGHIYGVESMKQGLREFSDFLDHLMESFPKIQVKIFSDHGMAPTKWEYINVPEILKSAGFNVRDNLKGENDIVVPQYAPVNFSRAYLFQGEDPKKLLEKKVLAADALRIIKGIDVVIYQSETGIVVANECGRAIIEYKQGDDGITRFRYVTLTADPLDYFAASKLVESDNDNFSTPNQWFEATNDHNYPLAIGRIYNALLDTIESGNPDIIAGLDLDYVSGRKDWYDEHPTKGTHSGLDKACSEACVLVEKLPETMRASEVKQLANL